MRRLVREIDRDLGRGACEPFLDGLDQLTPGVVHPAVDTQVVCEHPEPDHPHVVEAITSALLGAVTEGGKGLRDVNGMVPEFLLGTNP
ncbi:hypothetical protein [Streptomyces olivaceoviridis]